MKKLLLTASLICLFSPIMCNKKNNEEEDNTQTALISITAAAVTVTGLAYFCWPSEQPKIIEISSPQIKIDNSEARFYCAVSFIVGYLLCAHFNNAEKQKRLEKINDNLLKHLLKEEK